MNRTDHKNTQQTIQLSFSALTLKRHWIGDDLLLEVSGGNKPHIGCCILAQPRTSLSGDGSVSATSSVLNVVGHKDETVCRFLAEKAASALNCTCVCTGGFHFDNITPEQIQELISALQNIEF